MVQYTDCELVLAASGEQIGRVGRAIYQVSFSLPTTQTITDTYACNQPHDIRRATHGRGS